MSDSQQGAGNKRVYVGNLAWRVKWQDLKDHMKQVGEVRFAEIIDVNGRSKGCGIVEYVDAESAARAIAELNDTELLDRKMFVREDREGSEGFRPRRSAEKEPGDSAPRFNNRSNNTDVKLPPPCEETMGRQLYISNLPWNVSWKELKDLFGGSESVDRAEVAMDRDGRSRGFGCVILRDASQANKWIEELNGHELSGRQIGVKLDQGPPAYRERGSRPSENN